VTTSLRRSRERVLTALESMHRCYSARQWDALDRRGMGRAHEPAVSCGVGSLNSAAGLATELLLAAQSDSIHFNSWCELPTIHSERRRLCPFTLQSHITKSRLINWHSTSAYLLVCRCLRAASHRRRGRCAEIPQA